MYRKSNEAAHPDLAGNHPYAQQVPLKRAVPLWGAISSHGFHEIAYHKARKLNNEEWCDDVLKAGKFTKAMRVLQPGRRHRIRRVLCDSESFLEVKQCRDFYKKNNIKLVHIPSHSPDLNPIESFWGWLKKELRRRDLEDLRQKRPPLGKTAYKRRVKNILKGKKAQKAACAKFANFRKVCKVVALKKGAHSGQ